MQIYYGRVARRPVNTTTPCTGPSTLPRGLVRSLGATEKVVCNSPIKRDPKFSIKGPASVPWGIRFCI